MIYTISTAFAIYFVIWWIMLFVTLPFGVRTQEDDGETVPGTDPGAPALARMAAKLIWTTVLSAVFFALAWLAYDAGYLDVYWLSHLMGFPDFHN